MFFGKEEFRVKWWVFLLMVIFVSGAFACEKDEPASREKDFYEDIGVSEKERTVEKEEGEFIERRDIIGDVLYAQEILKEEGYLPGPLDGEYGPKTRASLYAFQKVHGIEVTGEICDDTMNALENDPQKRPEAKHIDRGGLHFEVDIESQLLLVVKEGEVSNVLHVSTGRNDRTPRGTFEIYSMDLEGWRNAVNREGEVIGEIYNPLRFFGPYYIHGSKDVPLYPASAGCVRIMPHHTYPLQDMAEVGTKVIIY